MPRSSLFTRSTFRMLTALALNNHREFFESNRGDYERHVREPALEFIRVMAPRLARISAHFRASDQKVGGSLMRVHRDIRFSRDKTPYKTNIGIQFRHEVGKNVHAPGYYVHVSPGECFVGAGIWHPDAGTLSLLREAIDKRGPEWRRIIGAKAFVARFDRRGDALRRPPQGYPPSHPLIEELKRKDHIAMVALEERQICAANFPDLVTEHFRATSRYMAFLCSALGLEF